MKRLLVTSFLIAFVGGLIGSWPARGQAPNEVLLLNSYHQGLQWTDNVVDGVQAFFDERRYTVAIQMEYLDTKRIDDPAYFDLVFNLFQHKFRQRAFDVIIASDDHAFSFLRAHAQDLFGDTPVVFCGVNYLTPAMLRPHPNFTGVIEAFDVRRTLALMARLQSGLERIVVVNDQTKTGRANRKILDAAIAKFEAPITFEFVGAIDMADLQKQIQALPPSAAVLLMSFTRDKSGQVFSYDESIARIAGSCPVPMYGVWDFYLGRGIVGGMLTSGFHQGYTAAGLAHKILEGRSVAEIPVVTDSPNRWMFDHAQLTRFGLNNAALPPDALVINRPVSFYSENKALIWGTGTIIVVQILVIGLLVFNIQRRKTVEAALGNSEGILKATLDSTTDGILVVTREGVVSHFNSRFREIWSLPQALLETGDDARMIAYVKSQLADPESFVSRVNVLYRSMEQSLDLLEFKDGRIIERFFTPLDIGGIEGGRVWFFRDVTEARRKDEALREGAQQLKVAQAMAHVGNWELEVATGLVGGSDEAARIFGLVAEDQPFASRKLLQRIDRSDRPRAVRAMRRLLSQQQNLDLEFRIVPQVSQGPCWVHVRARVALDAGGHAVRVVGTLQDVTARIEAEESRQALERQLVHAIKMEAVGTLAGGIAHDFNNLLQAISGYTQLMLMDRSLSGQELQPLRKIESAADRARELARQLLTFSRKVESHLAPSVLNAIVEDALQILGRTIPKMITIEKNLAPNLKPVEVDANQIEQVILNLGINAAHAMPEGGRLAITTAMARAGMEEGRPTEAAKGPYVELIIDDSGTGMDSQTLERIFDPFFTTKGIGSGTGLGLSMVYGIVQNHGGWITCRSAPGRGTTFKIYLPAIDTALDGLVMQKEFQELPCGGETILIVDDEVVLCELGRRMLERFGYRVKTAASGEEALEVFKRQGNGIDLVILDVNMPGMGGYKCLQALLQIDPQIKTIVASGYSRDHCERDLLSLGACAFIAKPFQLEALVTTVRETIDRVA